ncbi:MAG: ABC transporter ATP-binding protein [bacterium]|nr:ABC transporter ATP-binding protein [bacterium]
MNKIKRLWKDRKNQKSYIKWLFQYSKPYAWKILAMMGLNLLLTVVTIYMAVLSKQIIDEAIKGAKNKALVFVGLYFALIMLIQVVTAVVTLLSAVLNEKFSFGIRKQLYQKIINSHWMDVTSYHTGDLMTRLTSDIGNISDGIIVIVPEVIRLFIELILVFFTLFYYSPMLAVLGLVIGPIAALVAWWFARRLKKLQVKVQESEAAYRSFLQESLANLLIVKSFTNEDYAVDKLTKLRRERFYWVFKRSKFGVISSTAMSFSFQLGYIAAFAYGAMQIAEKAISYGTMSLFLTLVNRVQAPVLGLAQQVPKVASVVASAGRVMELQELSLENKSMESMHVNEVGVCINDLTFGYSDVTVLEHASLEINPGESVAIVGESGIGKTTLIRLIMSFMEKYTGTITFKDENGNKEIANARSREYISYVPQGNTLFSGTIRDNICMGNINATEKDIVDALKMASAYDFVMKLPEQLDAVIGERGHGLSEGQAQRIAIARAIVRNAPFLILDEATSSLDEQTELSVLQGLQNLVPRPTCLIITHRRSILKYCNRELKIAKKQIEEVVL